MQITFHSVRVSVVLWQRQVARAVTVNGLIFELHLDPLLIRYVVS